ncbi:GNAT family N-acetyltransferase [Xylanibacillus composti]|uniref:N-acetyltransferase GCN5 n=1 Tax=Xylanibacillus composti TaxID=1572762 RepID=A0A8J4H586_9BACL|nr:GNAT family N-acetyltransferase [Xylanibacillus composti]GIQ69910.1 N-acetyltransferase GCN5 [Xylanibacillus composti]
MQIRPIALEDEPFLFELYASTRLEEMANWGWDEPTARSFLQMQWNAQTHSYGTQFPNMRKELLLVQGQRAGRMLTCLMDEALLLVDISLLPAFRGQGYGTSLLKRMQHEAAQLGVAVRLTVRNDNRARRLYEQLGFRTVADNGADSRMEWREGFGM